MANESNIIPEDQIEQIIKQIEKRFVEYYRKKFIGVITGVSIAFLVIGYFGYDKIQESAIEKITEKAITGQYKEDVINRISDKILPSSIEIVNKIQKNKLDSDSLLSEIELQHRNVVEAATYEFNRTIEVLRRVRQEAVRNR